MSWFERECDDSLRIGYDKYRNYQLHVNISANKETVLKIFDVVSVASNRVEGTTLDISSFHQTAMKRNE